ncbi:MAG: 23S rRNA (pseudouridine(1915)-N(3))-methyltransferase RlmH [Rickettsiaceae bacterium]|nr:23S rRNA (pseudouridine(1915)-N(3))-methyltransferase RlmH [Rickettsiaceae bacterium]
MKINIISVGKLKDNYYELAQNYNKMINWKITSYEINYSKKIPANQIKEYEAELIKKYLNHSAYKISLVIDALQFSSENFSKLFGKQMMLGKNIDFIIGGAFGLSNEIIAMSDLNLSLSKMTMPHQLAKVILLEQIYRSQSIIENHPYHK